MLGLKAVEPQELLAPVQLLGALFGKRKKVGRVLLPGGFALSGRFKGLRRKGVDCF